MFSFFKKSKKRETPKAVPDAHTDLRKAVSDLRSEFSDETLARGMGLLDRVSGLRSVQLSFFQSLLELTDQVSDRMVDHYDEFGTFNALEVHAFCASIVATAIAASDLPEDERPSIVDIYLSLWVDSVVEHGKGINGPALKAQMGKLWAEYCPLVVRAASEPTPQIVHDPESAAVRLVRNVDRLAGIERDEVRQKVVAVTFKVTTMEAIRIVCELASSDAEA